MAFTFVGNSGFQSGTAGSTSMSAHPSSEAGDYLIAVFAFEGVAAGSGPWVASADGWTRLLYQAPAGTGNGLEVWGAHVPTQNGTFTFDTTRTYAARMATFRGFLGYEVHDAATSQITGDNPSAPSITASTGDGILVVGAHEVQSPGWGAPTGGFTTRFDNARGGTFGNTEVYLGSRVASSDGATGTADWTLTAEAPTTEGATAQFALINRGTDAKLGALAPQSRGKALSRLAKPVDVLFGGEGIAFGGPGVVLTSVLASSPRGRRFTRPKPVAKLSPPTVVGSRIAFSGPRVGLYARLRSGRLYATTSNLAPPAVVFGGGGIAFLGPRVLLVPQSRRPGRTRLGRPQVVGDFVEATQFFGPGTALAPVFITHRRIRAKSRLSPPVVVGAISLRRRPIYLTRPRRVVARVFKLRPPPVVGRGRAFTRRVVYLTRSRRAILLASTLRGPTVVNFDTDANVPFIASQTQVFDLLVVDVQTEIAVPFIASQTQVYSLVLTRPSEDIAIPFIGSNTVLYPFFSIFEETEGFGTGNGGETFSLQLNANGITTFATLSGDIAADATTLLMTGDSGMPTSGGFVVTIDSEVLWVSRSGPGRYSIRSHALSGTTAAAHTNGATISWNDTYYMAMTSLAQVAFETTWADDGLVYQSWLIAFDSTQAYLNGDRYAFHVTELTSVETSLGSGNKLDAPQPNGVCVPAGVTDDCPAAMTVPARLTADMEVGDLVLVRYTNPEAQILKLGPRSVAVQSWYGFLRVNDFNVDVTDTDPNGHCVDGSVQDSWFNTQFTTVTLPAVDRNFTNPDIGDNRAGWPLAALAVRQGTRRVPYWESPDWHNFAYVYSGFGTDATYVQILINRNGLVFGPLPSVVLPNNLDIDGPNATWDSYDYNISVAWYVAMFKNTILFVGPPINVPPSSGGGSPPIYNVPPGSSSGGGGSGPGGNPPPDYIEGGAGGDIPAPDTNARLSFDAVL